MTARLPLPILMSNVVRPVVDGIYHDPKVDPCPPVHFVVFAVELGQPLTTGQFCTNMTSDQFSRIANYLNQMAKMVHLNESLTAPLGPVSPQAANDTKKRG